VAQVKMKGRERKGERWEGRCFKKCFTLSSYDIV